jgi:hypothetical protein
MHFTIGQDHRIAPDMGKTEQELRALAQSLCGYLNKGNHWARLWRLSASRLGCRKCE